jgi:hypothetical protein
VSTVNINHMLATADNDGFLMPSYVGTDYEQRGRDEGCVKDGSIDIGSGPVSWPRLTKKGLWWRDYYRRVGLPR